VTLRWPTIIGRLSASILTCVGLEDWIAESADDYISLAISKAANLGQLAAVRESCRSLFLQSSVGNRQDYVKSVEEQYRLMWKEYCVSEHSLTYENEKIA